MSDQSCFTCAKREGTRCGETRLMVLADSGHHCRWYEARDRQQRNELSKDPTDTGPDTVLNAVEALHQSADRYRSELGLLKLAHALNLSPTLIAGLEADVADRRCEFKAACAAFDAALEAES